MLINGENWSTDVNIQTQMFNIIYMPDPDFAYPASRAFLSGKLLNNPTLHAKLGLAIKKRSASWV